MLPQAQRSFVLLHEQGHIVLNTRDELTADKYAFLQFAKQGFPLSLAVKSLTRNLDGQNPAHRIRAKALLALALNWDARVNRNKNKLLTMQERIDTQNMHLSENREAMIEALRQGDFDKARLHLNEIMMHFPPEEHATRLARYEELFEQYKAAQLESFEGQEGQPEGIDHSDVYHYCGCGCEGKTDLLYENIADAAFSGFSDEELDQLDGFVCLAKSCRERKNISVESKADARRIKAEARQTKADAKKIKAQAKLELAKQGIKSGFGDDLKGALGGLGDLAGKAASAVASIKGGGGMIGGKTEEVPNTEPPSPSPETPAPAPKSKTWLWVGLGTGFAIVIGIVAFVFFRKKT
jgi:hypothetical protein